MLNRITEKMCSFFEKKLNSDTILTGDDISEFCYNYDKLFVSSIIFQIILILVSLFLDHIVLLSLSPITILLVFYPLIKEKSRKENFLKNVERELPIFSAFLYVDTMLGKSVYQTILSLKNSMILKGISKEAILLEKNVKLRSVPISTILLERARLYGKNNLGRVYSEFIEAETVGVSPNQKAKQSLEKIMGEMKQNFNGYVQRSTDLSELMFSFFLLLPIMLLSFQLAFNKTLNLSQLLIPLAISPAFYFVISSFQPQSDYILKFTDKRVIISILISFLTAPLVYIWLGLSYVFMISTLVISFSIYLQIREADQIAKQLPSLLDKISDYSRIGYGLRSSIDKIVSSGNVSPRTKEFLLEFLKSSDKNIKLNSPSWIFNAVFELLKRIDNVGYMDVKVFSEMSSIIQEMLNMKSSMQNNLQLFTVISAITPFLFSFTLHSFYFVNGQQGILSQVIVVYTIVIELLYSKISKFTIFNFPLIMVTTALSIILSLISVPF